MFSVKRNNIIKSCNHIVSVPLEYDGVESGHFQQ